MERQLPPRLEGSRRGGWRWFLAWAAAGAVLGMQVSVIGLVVLPLGVILAVVLVRRAGALEALGGFAGIGGTFVVFGLLQLGERQCSDLSAQEVGPGSCGYSHPMFWLTLGLVLLAASSVAYAALRHAQSPRPRSR